MSENFFSFKIIVHEVRLEASAIFIEESEKAFHNPVLLVKLLKFPLLIIKGKKSIVRENWKNLTKGLFEHGVATAFKIPDYKLKADLLETPLKIIFVDYDFEKKFVFSFTQPNFFIAKY